jgi:cytochrome c oxidase cbb3-type subunit 2
LLNTTSLLQHLYNPQKEMPGSMMPPYNFLFTTRKLTGSESVSARALPAGFLPGFEIIPKPDALSLVAYLNSLQSDVSLTNAPFSVPPAKAAPATNAPPAP